LRKQCAHATLAFVQATDTSAHTHLAEQLLAFWQSCLSDSSRLYALLEEHKLGMTDMKLLHALAYCPSPPTVKDLAERMGLSLPGASRAADALLRRGWVERREDEHDRRMKRLRITPAGEQVLHSIEEARLAGLEARIAGLPPKQLERLSAALTPILNALEVEGPKQ
jgi:DNA-binding MarR family transcriptional regulator